MKKGCIGLWSLVAGIIFSSWAAAGLVGRVDFDEGMDGMISRSSAGHLVWEVTDGHARASFPSSSQMPLPGDFVMLVGDGLAAGGAFTGNYRDEHVALIGFDFQTDEMVPRNGFRIELEGPAGVIWKDVTSRVTSLGDWHRIVLRLDRRDVNGWLPEDNALFEAVLSNVQEVRIYLARSGHSSTQIHRVDNLFVGRLHRTAKVEVEREGQPSISWAGLLDDAEYRLESTTDLQSGEWRLEGRFPGSTADINWTAPAPEEDDESPVRFYRLVLD